MMKQNKSPINKSHVRRRPRSNTRSWPQHLLKVRWIPEPNLIFANDGKSTDPKEGLSLYGPFSISTSEHHQSIRVGFVGTETTIAQAKAWLDKCSKFIPGVENKRRQFPDFPGFNLETAFQSEFVLNKAWESIISQRDLSNVLMLGDKVKGFEQAVDLFATRVSLISDLDVADVIICALPEEIENYYSSIGQDEVRTSPSGLMSPLARAIRRIVREAEKRGQATFLAELFPEEATTPPGLLRRNFRRALKAKTNRANCPVQILRQRSLVEGDPTAQDPASRAWNFVVGMYFKSRGRPWHVDGLDLDTCYVGISFYHYVTEELHTVHSSLAQLFTSQGDSLVLRGERFEWDPDSQGRSPHLTNDYAQKLISYILRKYYDYKGVYPRRVVVHKTSKFYDAERDGFISGLVGSNISQYDLVALEQTGVRFFREGNYPPIRGTWCQLGRTGHWLYTTGYLPTQGTYPRPHVPMPLQLLDKHGDSTYEKLLHEILALSKMNWNSANNSSAFPITLLFARKVGEILTYLPEDIEPNPNFRFYC